MSNRRSLALLAIAGTLSACATTPKSEIPPVARITLLSADGASRGMATLRESAGKLELSVAALDLPPGPHGVHLHAVGACAAPGFTSAGPHLNPHARQHGAENPQGSHLGDMPNLTAGPDGKGTLSVILQGTSEELKSQLFDADSTALVIHATADDYRTDPTGNSGARIACGVLTPG